ncbi:MAG: hypothetical protein AAF518_03570 [Spirochaetota bacterium]
MFEQAYTIEKIAPRFSIVLYENTLKKSRPRTRIRRIAIHRLFYLYAKFSMYEDIFILNEKYPPRKSRRKYTKKLIQKMAKRFAFNEELASKVLPLASKTDEESTKQLLTLYNTEPNFHLFRFIFYIKLKIKDKAGLKYCLSELSGINPVFKLVYILKQVPKKMPSYVHKYASQVSLSNQQKMDILYLYGIYLRDRHRYRMAVRYLRMSSSFNTFNTSKRYLNRSLTEAARVLITSGRSREGCSLARGKKIYVQNTADKLLHFYCKERNIQKIRTLKPALLQLAEKENNLFFKKILKIVY